jgi:hypothetical protein
MNSTLLNRSSTLSRRRTAGLAIVLTSLLLGACATTAPAADPQAAVRERASARWQALLAGNFTKAYTFTTPTYKAKVSEADYVARFQRPQWWGAEVATVTCAQPTSCTARVRVDAKVFLPHTTMNKITTYTDEAWLLEDGQWGLKDD